MNELQEQTQQVTWWLNQLHDDLYWLNITAAIIVLMLVAIFVTVLVKKTR